MKVRAEEVDGRIADCIEAWRSARQHCATIPDEIARAAAERVADSLRDDHMRHCLSPLFKAALKSKSKAKKPKPQ